MLDAIDDRVTAAFGDHHHLPALEFQPSRTAAGRDFLLEEHQHRQTCILDRRMQVPAHQPLAAYLQRQLRFLDDLSAVAVLLALTVTYREQIVPMIDLRQLRLPITCHSVSLRNYDSLDPYSLCALPLRIFFCISSPMQSEFSTTQFAGSMVWCGQSEEKQNKSSAWLNSSIQAKCLRFLGIVIGWVEKRTCSSTYSLGSFFKLRSPDASLRSTNAISPDELMKKSSSRSMKSGSHQ